MENLKPTFTDPKAIKNFHDLWAALSDKYYNESLIPGGLKKEIVVTQIFESMETSLGVTGNILKIDMIDENLGPLINIQYMYYPDTDLFYRQHITVENDLNGEPVGNIITAKENDDLIITIKETNLTFNFKNIYMFESFRNMLFDDSKCTFESDITPQLPSLGNADVIKDEIVF